MWPVAQRLPELSLLARQLNENLKARGVVEGLLTFVYLSTAATDRGDCEAEPGEAHSRRPPDSRRGADDDSPAGGSFR